MNAVETAVFNHTESAASVGHLTEREWKRVLRGAPFCILQKPEQFAWAAERGLATVRCIGCRHAGDAGHDPWRAWCMRFRCMVSNTFEKLCPGYEASAE